MKWFRRCNLVMDRGSNSETGTGMENEKGFRKTQPRDDRQPIEGTERDGRRGDGMTTTTRKNDRTDGSRYPAGGGERTPLVEKERRKRDDKSNLT